MRGLSSAERLALLSAAERASTLDGMSAAAIALLEGDWRWWARPDQLPPPGDWRIWLVMAGRGFGKTRMGAEWVRQVAAATPRARIALVGATMNDVRRVMVEGDSGVLNLGPLAARPKWEPSLMRLTWANGAQAFGYSAAEPDSLRGPQHHAAWADEIGKWAEGEAAWDNLAMTLRAGKHPRVVATTTPRPVALVRRLAKADGVVITQGPSHANAAHLATEFLAEMTATYGGTRLGRQEIDGALIEEIAGALWTRALIEGVRARTVPPFVRVVVGVDPPAGETGDACGIVVVARSADGRGHVIEDASVRGVSPQDWAGAVAGAAARHKADRVVAEANNGGAMVRSVLHAADAGLPVTLVHASHGKAARAEPVAMLYASGRVTHVGAFPALEDEMCGLIAGGGYAGPGRSPDRADALVWALTELMLGRRGVAGVRVV